DDTIIVIEEHYLVDDIECVIYVKNKNSNIQGLNLFSLILNKVYLYDNFNALTYDIINESGIGNFSSDYDYYITINSTDTTTIESIFSNLTNN
ncbi:MAG: hypothetical protein K2N42_01745, partial [Anaeroplasmataceae bacterium]|nr:hypothetical protein [Anaeroplasmataceae bacterium]